MRIETKSVHVGVRKDDTFNSVITPIYPSSTFEFDAVGKNRGYDYTRSGNPTRSALEENLAALEGGARAWATCTGMSAITATMFLLKPGDHVVAGHDIYGGTYRLFDSVLRKWGLDFSFVDMRDPENVRCALRPNTRMVWIETPSNPLLNLVDIQAVAAIAAGNGCLSVSDNTFLSPVSQSPFALGVDIIVHSSTKYINGHSDVVGGVIVVKEDNSIAEDVKYVVNALGVAQAPFDSWLVLRGVKTLKQRVRAHEEGASALARFLEGHPRVTRVYYPGLQSHPQHELAKRQMAGFGGMLAFELDTQQISVDRLFAGLGLFSLAESLGGVESLVEHPWTMSHASMPEPARIGAGISPNTIRVSVGIEHPDDLIEAMGAALDAV